MSRRYTDVIAVRRGEDMPEQFVWRNRRYRVLAVVQRWVETGAWWLPGESAGEDEEYEIWRVEAVTGRRSDHAGQYDLCRNCASGRWFMVRAFD